MNVGPVSRDAATAEFFEAAAAGRLLLRVCPDGHVSEPAVAQCSACGSVELHWTPAGGGAALVSWAVSWGRAVGDDPPERTVLVIAELDEGPWWWSQLADVDPDAVLAEGQRLRIEFRRADGEHEPVPVFVLA